MLEVAPFRCRGCNKYLAVKATTGTIVDCPRCHTRNTVGGLAPA